MTQLHLNREQRRKILRDPESYKPALVARAREIEREDKGLTEFKNKVTTREDVREILAHYHNTRVVPALDELFREIQWLQLPWYKRAWFRVNAWWADRREDGPQKGGGEPPPEGPPVAMGEPE